MKAGVFAASILREGSEELGLLASQDIVSREAVVESDFRFFHQLLQSSRERERSVGGRRDGMRLPALKRAAAGD